ncbi:expressed unknown protein [Seminavis robusta]|uniref:Uncharacterized protein n=1 Tax=Seminavis robusta TaxID=568900 RepID=A0A9N8DWY8_9STRA|nr:expressed unknown protein [Seminavis robusta]|eukprot:Sro343_g122100.1 n/a (230) ;mRNA; r:70167-70856
MTSTVFDLNNQGIHYLQQGSLGEAANTFQSALMRLREVLYRTIKADTTQRSSSSSSIDNRIAIPTRTGPSSPSNVLQNENQFSLFDQAFILPCRLSESEILLSVDLENLVSCCLLYNLALTYHKRGLATGKSKDLQQAVSLYQKAATLGDFVEELAEQSLLQILAVFNNLGHIYSEHFESAQVSGCMDSILMILESSESYEHLQEEDYNFFSWHFFLYPEIPVWLAPAA